MCGGCVVRFPTLEVWEIEVVDPFTAAGLLHSRILQFDWIKASKLTAR